MNNSIEYGQYLKSERDQQGISLEKVSNDTKISKKMLMALESMDKTVFPSETYLIGMLKIYAKYLSIDQSKILQMLKVNEIQETPVEFDVINIQFKKKKKQKRLLLILGIIVFVVLIASFFLLGIHTSISNKLGELKSKRNTTEVDVSQLEKITGFYEAMFQVGEKYILSHNAIETLLEIESVDPPLILIDGREILLQTQNPMLLDLDNNGTPEYVLLMRFVHTERNQMQLRFDPRIEQTSYDEDLANNTQEKVYIPDGDILEITQSQNIIPIQISLTFSGESYFKITTQAETIAEVLVNRGDSEFYTSEEPVHIYLSNTSFVALTINDQEVSLPDSGLPIVLRIVWVYTGNQYILQAIPLP